jgi:sulfur carrier protein ThiS
VRVAVHLHGNLRRFGPAGADRSVLEVAPDATVEAVLARLGAERDTWLVAVNGITVDRDRVLHAEDVLDCFEPVAAG